MNYDWMKYEVIKNAKYPNLLAEIKESEYSICTISDHLGLGMCKENDPIIWDKLTGKTDILVHEAAALAALFGVEQKYLFSKKLYVIAGKSVGYWRWIDNKARRRKEFEIIDCLDDISRLIREQDDLEFAKAVYSFALEYIGQALPGPGAKCLKKYSEK